MHNVMISEGFLIAATFNFRLKLPKIQTNNTLFTQAKVKQQVTKTLCKFFFETLRQNE